MDPHIEHHKYNIISLPAARSVPGTDAGRIPGMAFSAHAGAMQSADSLHMRGGWRGGNLWWTRTRRGARPASYRHRFAL